MGNWIRGRPFLCYFLLALAFPTVLFAYLIAFEWWQQAVYGPDHGALGAMFVTEHVGVRSRLTWQPAVIWFAAAGTVIALCGTRLGWARRMALHGGDGASDPARAWWSEEVSK